MTNFCHSVTYILRCGLLMYEKYLEKIILKWPFKTYSSNQISSRICERILFFFLINFKRLQQYGHVTTLKYVLYKVAFSVCSDSFCMRWFGWGGPEIRDQWNFKLFIGSSFFSNFRTIAAHTTIRPFNGEIRQRTSNLKVWMNSLFIYSHSKHIFFKLQDHFCHYNHPYH